MLVPSNSGGFTKEHVDDEGNDPGGVLITETPDVIMLSTGENSDSNRNLHGLVGTFYLSKLVLGLDTSGLDKQFMFNTDLHEVC